MDRLGGRFKPRGCGPRLVACARWMAYASGLVFLAQARERTPSMPPATTESRPASPAAWVAVGALCAAVIGGPLCLGAAPTWPRLAVEAALATAVVAWVCTRTGSRRLVLVPLAIVALVCLQIVPLSGGLLMRLAPVSAGRWAVADEGVHGLWRTVSVDPAATAAGARRLLLGLLAAAAVADLGRVKRCRLWLAGSLGLSGIIVLVTGWLFPVRDRIVLGGIDLKGPIDYWLTPLEPARVTAGFGYPKWITVAGYRYLTIDAASADGFGCYLNSNHYAGALCLTLPLVLGGWLWLTFGRLPGLVRSAAVVAGIALAVWTAGRMAGSRAGAASLLFGGLVFVSLVAGHPWLRRGAAAAVAACGVGIVSFLVAFLGGFTDVVEWFPEAWQPRIAGLLHDPRIAASAAAVRLFRAAPLLGTGLDTYGEVSSIVTKNAGRLFFAHNDYAQVLAETGLVGALVVIAIAALFAVRLWRFAGGGDAPLRPLDAGVWAALAGIAVHSCFDWNLHIPANALLACINAGLALASAAAIATPAPLRPGRGARRWLAVATVFACLAAVGLLARDAWSEHVQRRLRTAVADGRIALADPARPADAAVLAAAIEAGERAARYDPANPRLAAFLGQASLHLAALAPTGEPSRPRIDAALDWFTRARRAAAPFADICEPLPPEPPPERKTAGAIGRFFR